MLEEFLSSAGSSLKTFGYFNKRDKSVLDNHVVTFIGILNGAPVAYGHLDREEDKVWLGICVKEKYTGRGYGKKIMEKLVTSHDGDIHLSVDKDNEEAINLYKFFSVEEIDSNDKLYFMRRNATNI